ncbi:DUF2057 domain-containing protein [Marinobacterium jannaschii]|uniref:DUF2057 domain-containing protein n=1 Tax=Marinobacterium jannaschii TaxID=64970 RepID=UPI000A056E25|nr:DUF2057 domain-containing protein [Marinobacterium jannaschii]
MVVQRLSVFFIGLTCICSNVAFAESVLRLQDGISVLAKNGHETDSSDFRDNQSALVLSTGTNQLLARYSVELSTGDGDLEKSDTFVLLFDAAGGQTLQLNVPDIKRSRDLKAFNRSGNWQLSDPSGQAVSYKKAVIKKQGFQLGRDYERELEKFNKTDSPAAYSFNRPAVKLATNSFSESFNPERQSSLPSANTGPDRVMTEQMLKYWYNQADFKTRERFKSWISQ